MHFISILHAPDSRTLINYTFSTNEFYNKMHRRQLTSDKYTESTSNMQNDAKKATIHILLYHIIIFTAKERMIDCKEIGFFIRIDT